MQLSLEVDAVALPLPFAASEPERDGYRKLCGTESGSAPAQYWVPTVCLQNSRATPVSARSWAQGSDGNKGLRGKKKTRKSRFWLLCGK